MKKLVILCLMAALATGAAAQTIELDLQQAIDLALSENLTIKIADMEVERYDYVKKEYIGNLLPNLSATGGYTRSIIKQKLGGSISIEGDNTISGGASLSLPLIAPGIWSSLKLTREQMYGAVETARGSRLTLVNEVKKAYYNTLLAKRSLSVLHASEATVSETVENTRTMFNNGLAAEYDLITAEVQLSNLRPTIIQTENSIKIAEMLLKVYLSLPENVEIVLTGSLESYKDGILLEGDTFSTDISQNSDLKSLEIQERVLERQFKLQRTQRMPTLAAVSNFTITGQDLNVKGIFADPSTPVEPSKYKYNWQHPLSAGVQLSVPIFAGFSRTNKEKQIKNNMEQLRMQREYFEENTSVQVRSSISNIITAREQMYANEKTVAQAQKAYDISKVRYNAGAGTMLELNNSELSLTQAKLNYTQAVYDFLSAQADYEKIIGKDIN